MFVSSWQLRRSYPSAYRNHKHTHTHVRNHRNIIIVGCLSPRSFFNKIASAALFIFFPAAENYVVCMNYTRGEIEFQPEKSIAKITLPGGFPSVRGEHGAKLGEVLLHCVDALLHELGLPLAVPVTTKKKIRQNFYIHQ